MHEALKNRGRPGSPIVAGSIDADGHVLEPADLWLKYMEPKYRDRAMRIVANDAGLEYVLVDGKPGKFLPPGFLGIIGAMGDEDLSFGPERSYGTTVAFGAMDLKDRLERMTNERMRAALLYPTVGLAPFVEPIDPEIGGAYCRAYNRWIMEYCSDSGGRLIPIAMVDLSDVAEATRELERTVRAGVKGAFFVPSSTRGKSPAHPVFDPFWSAAQDLGVPIAMHPIAEQMDRIGDSRFEELRQSRDTFMPTWFFLFLELQAVQETFLSLFQHDLFGRFPKIKVVILESTAGWVGPLLEQMDERFEGMFGVFTPMKEPPSHFFRRQCWIAADGDERVVLGTMDYVGTDRFVWASDFPHPDHDDRYLEHLVGLVEPLSEENRQRLLWKNVTECYGLELP